MDVGIKQALFYAKYWLYRPQAFRASRALRASQYDTVETQRRVQLERLRALVAHALTEVPFYRRRYAEAGFTPIDLARDDFSERLPILTKQDVRAHYAELGCPRLAHHGAVTTTGGSTGVPTKILFDKRLPNEALAWRMLSWWGLEPSMDGAFIWRERRSSGMTRALNAALRYPTLKLRLNCATLNAARIEAFLARFNKVRPPLLQGYVGAVAELAAYVRRTGAAVHRPQAVWLTSAPVSDVQRNLIESAFGAPVYDQYGCCEAPFIAAQCAARQGLHVNTEVVRLDFVDDDGHPAVPGAWGRTLVTKLDDFVFPLIRYEVGDRGRWLPDACTCGVRLPMIDRVKGRITDVFRLPSGRVISGEYLTTIFDRHPAAVEAFQVIQRRDASIDITYVPAAASGLDAIVAEVLSTVQAQVGGEVPVRAAAVAAIGHDRGKARLVLSESATDATSSHH